MPLPSTLRAALLAPLLALSGAVAADSFVWTVSDGERSVHVGGTIHVLGEDEFPLPEEFGEAYAASDEVVFETDIAALATPATRARFARALAYPDGETLADHVEADTLEALERFAAERGVPFGQLLPFRPGLVVSTLTYVELSRLGLDGQGVDAHFTDRAREDERAIGALESVDEQIGFVASMGEDDPDRLLRHTLRDLGRLDEMVDTMLGAWRAGDRPRLARELVEPMREQFPSLYETLLVERNAAWVPRIEAMLETDEVELVLVGAAHLVGEHGVLAALEARGYTVERF